MDLLYVKNFLSREPLNMFYISIILAVSFFVISNASASDLENDQVIIDEMVTEYPASVRNFQLALAKRGNITAQLTLAKIYHHGIGVEVDIIIAEQWYMLAAASGNEYASDVLVYLEIMREGAIQEKHEKWSEEFIKREDSAPIIARMIDDIRDIKKTQASLKIPQAVKQQVEKPAKAKQAVVTQHSLKNQQAVDILRPPEAKQIVTMQLPREIKKSQQTVNKPAIICAADDCASRTASQN